MLFTLEAIDAKQGDCLLLSCGAAEDPQILLIDGGPRGVYRNSLRPRLDQLRAHRGSEEPLPIRLAVVSHIDDDHIRGILDLAKAMEELGGAEPYDVQELWHNSFDDIVGGPLQSDAKLAAVAATRGPSSSRASAGESHAIVASVPQGRDLRRLARKLNWDLNHGFADGAEPFVMVAQDEQCRVFDNLAPGLRLTVLAPRKDEIDALQKEWDRQLVDKNLAEVLAYSDRSVFNLSSIVMLAEANQRSMLLTGDARGDSILSALEAADLLDADGVFRCEVLKVPHHGSHRNVTEEFFRRVPAEHYVISADGRHDNPDVRTMEMLTTARGEAEYALWFTNRVASVADYLHQDGSQPNRNYKVYFADEKPGHPIQIHLGFSSPSFCDSTL
jgi:beta-lactamase superfamily II metal-dependent hydrolase